MSLSGMPYVIPLEWSASSTIVERSETFFQRFRLLAGIDLNWGYICDRSVFTRISFFIE